MPNLAELKWPSYSLGPEKHVHALGVVAINYNALELALDRFIHMYLGASDEAHAYVFKALNSNSQTELFKLVVGQAEKDADLRDRLLGFCDAYGICYGNRNLLMHSLVHAELTTDDVLALAKKSGNKPHTYNQLHLKLPELRSLADDMRAWFVYAAEVMRHIKVRNRQRGQPSRDGQHSPLPALPDKPAPPSDLKKRILPNL